MSSGGGDSSSDKTWKIAKKQYKAAKPIQRRVYSGLIDFLDNGMDMSNNPVYMAGKRGIEDQYQMARQGVLEQMPAGGAMLSSLGGIEQGKAASLSDLMSQQWQDQMNKAYGVATGAPQQSLAQLSSIGASRDAANTAADASNNQAIAGTATSLGTLIAMLAFG